MKWFKSGLFGQPSKIDARDVHLLGSWRQVKHCCRLLPAGGVRAKKSSLAQELNSPKGRNVGDIAVGGWVDMWVKG